MTTITQKCYRRHFREIQDCPHFLQECNLCGEKTYCEGHGCSVCNLKHRDNSQALTVTPPAEREILIRVSKRTKPEEKQFKRKARRIKKYNHRDRYLDDLIASNS